MGDGSLLVQGSVHIDPGGYVQSGAPYPERVWVRRLGIRPVRSGRHETQGSIQLFLNRITGVWCPTITTGNGCEMVCYTMQLFSATPSLC